MIVNWWSDGLINGFLLLMMMVMLMLIMLMMMMMMMMMLMMILMMTMMMMILMIEVLPAVMISDCYIPSCSLIVSHTLSLKIPS